MQKVSFKKFSSFVDLTEDPSEQQIQEIFGIFQNNNKADELKKKRDELKAQQDAKRKEIQKKKDELWAAARDKVMGKSTTTSQRPGLQPTGRTSAAAQGKRAERDWLANMAESVSTELESEMESIAKKILDGDLDVNDILSGHAHVSSEAQRYVQNEYDRAAEGGHRHADDDFEDIGFEVGTSLIQNFLDPNYRG